MTLLEIKAENHTYRLYRSVYSPVESNMYVLIEGKDAVVVDSNISEEVLDVMKERKVETVHLFLTHEHYDHCHGVWWVQENFKTVLYCHKGCEGQLSTKKKSSPRLVAFVLAEKDKNNGTNQYEEFKKSIREYSLEPDVFLDDSQTICIAGHHITAYHTPGHSPGSCIYVVDEKIVFSGDCMIDGRKIITAFKGGNAEEMQSYTLPKLKSLADDLWILPGHGEPFNKKDFKFDIYNV